MYLSSDKYATTNYNIRVYIRMHVCIYVIQELQHRIQLVIDMWGPNGTQPNSEAIYKEEMEKIRKDIVDFHGEMVLLENYSNINYTGPFLYDFSY